MNTAPRVFTQEDFARWGRKGGKRGSKADKIRAGKLRWSKPKAKAKTKKAKN